MVSLVFYYHRSNRYSFNALIGACEDILYEITGGKDIFFPETKGMLLKIIDELSNGYKKILVFFSFLTPQYWDMKEILTELTRHPNRERMSFVTGGPHASALPKETLNMGFDYVFIGEAEESLRIFLESFLHNDEKFPHVKGLSYKQDGCFISHGKADPVDLNAYPPFSLKFNLAGPIELTRGCPHLCKYCQTPRLFGTKVRHRSIDKIIHHAEALLKKGMKDLRFITPNAFSYGSHDGRELDFEALHTLLRELKSLTRYYNGRIFFGSFPSEVRPEHVNVDTLALIKEFCANDNLVIGAQTGSDRMLDYLMRGHSVEDVRRAVELTLKAGLKAKVDFIFGLPGENADDIKATLLFMEELASKGAYIRAHTFMPLPQTPFMRKRAGDISPELTKLIHKLLPHGKVIGYWEKQRELARKILDEIVKKLV